MLVHGTRATVDNYHVTPSFPTPGDPGHTLIPGPLFPNPKRISVDRCVESPITEVIALTGQCCRRHLYLMGRDRSFNRGFSLGPRFALYWWLAPCGPRVIATDDLKVAFHAHFFVVPCPAPTALSVVYNGHHHVWFCSSSLTTQRPRRFHTLSAFLTRPNHQCHLFSTAPAKSTFTPLVFPPCGN